MSRTRLHLLVLALSLAGYVWIALNVLQPHGGTGVWSAVAAQSITPCPIKLATGLPCPSCGTTRAMEALALGDVAGSLKSNPLGLLAAFSLLIFPPWVLHDLFRRRDAFFRFYCAVERTLQRHHGVAIACVALVAANWGWNILKGL